MSANNAQRKQLDEVLSVVHAVANGQFHVAFPGPLVAQLVVPRLEMPPPPPPPPAAPQSSALQEEAPEYELFDARSVADVWREWRKGVGGRPALEGLEEAWGHLLRPTARQATAWSRRRVVVDDLRRLVASGRSEEEAVEELEALRGGRHLRRLIDDLKARQRAQKAG